MRVRKRTRGGRVGGDDSDARTGPRVAAIRGCGDRRGDDTEAVAAVNGIVRGSGLGTRALSRAGPAATNGSQGEFSETSSGTRARGTGMRDRETQGARRTEDSKDEGLAGLGIDADGRRGANRKACPTGQGGHLRRVVGSPTGHEELARPFLCETGEVVGDAGRDEIRGGREQVVRPAAEQAARACAIHDPVDPVGSERVTAGALRRRALEKRMPQQFLDEIWIRPSAGGALPIAVERRIEESPRESVEERVRGAGVERLELAAAPEQRQVPEATQVEDRGRFLDVGEEQHVGERRERSAFASGSDVALAEVADDGATGFGGHEIAVAELERGRAARLDAVVVPQGLAVTRDEIECESVSIRHGACGATEGTTEVAIEQRDLTQAASSTFEDRTHAAGDVVGVRLGRVADEIGWREFDSVSARACSLPHDPDIDAVGGGAREDAGDQRAFGQKTAFEIPHRAGE